MNLCLVTSSFPTHTGDIAAPFVPPLMDELRARGDSVWVLAPTKPNAPVGWNENETVYWFPWPAGTERLVNLNPRSPRDVWRMWRLMQSGERALLNLVRAKKIDACGLENLRQTAGLLGLTKDALERNLERILEFADIGDAVDSPVKQYSSGMKTRLGMALAVHSEPELLLIDEVLAVGDRAFQKKAITAVRELVGRGASAAFVSHDLELVEEICDRVVRLEKGRVVDEGPVRDVVDRTGGSGWTGGIQQITSQVRVDRLVLTPRQVPPNGRLEFEGRVEVFEPSPTIRLEFALMARTGNPNELTEARLQRAIVFKREVVPAGGPLCEVGQYRFSGCVPRNPMLGELYVMVTAIDEREAKVTAQVWQDLKIGTRIQMEVLTLPIELEWEVVGRFDPATAPSEMIS